MRKLTSVLLAFTLVTPLFAELGSNKSEHDRGTVSSTPSVAEENLRCDSRIFISPMPDELDGYIRAKLVEKHVPLTIVMSKDNAALIMTGTSQQYQDHWYAATRDKNTGAVTISDKGGTFIWSAAAGDRNIWWGNLAKHGPEKVATRIVDKLKSAIQPCTSK